MKRIAKIVLLFPIVTLLILLGSCNHGIEIDNEGIEVEKIELTASELQLKKQMEEAAVIITEIIKDKEVLNELVASIEEQPKCFEDRVKFKQLMNSTELKSTSNSLKFKSAFEEKINNSLLKSTNNLIESLIGDDVEINIPYPIEDFPEGTDIVVTSHPLDNLDENIGYFVSSGQKVLVNKELTELYPIVIVWPKTITSDSVAVAKLQAGANLLEKESTNKNKTPLKSAQQLYPTDHQSFELWESEDHTHFIYINAIYVKDDHRPTFGNNTNLYFAAGSITYNAATKTTTVNANGTGTDLANPGHFTVNIQPKMVRYAEKGYSRGWIRNDNRLLMSDWLPAQRNTTFSGLAKISRGGATLKIDFGLTVALILSAINPEMAIVSKFAKDIVTFTKEFSVNNAESYGAIPMTRDAYRHLYNSAGTKWGEIGERNLPIDGFGCRPALTINDDLLYVTTWVAVKN